MEVKLETFIESKLDKEMEAITTLNKIIKEQSCVTAETITEGEIVLRSVKRANGNRF